MAEAESGRVDGFVKPDFAGFVIRFYLKQLFYLLFCVSQVKVYAGKENH